MASVANFPPWAVVEDHLISHKSLNATQLDALTLPCIEEHAKWCTVLDDKGMSTKQETHSGKIQIGKITSAIMKKIGTVESGGKFEGLTDLLAGGADDSVDNFVDFWWSHVHRKESNSRMAWLTADVNENGLIEIPIACYISISNSTIGGRSSSRATTRHSRSSAADSPSASTRRSSPVMSSPP